VGHSIRYTTTDDNISIAFATLGAGRPLLCLPPFPFSHLEAGWRLEGQRFWYEQLSQSMDVALFDGRGTGLSDRDPIDFSLNAMTLDIEAVVRKLNWNQFVLCGMFNSTPLAIAYAARHPDTVTDLILWGLSLEVSMSIPSRSPEKRRNSCPFTGRRSSRQPQSLGARGIQTRTALPTSSACASSPIQPSRCTRQPVPMTWKPI